MVEKMMSPKDKEEMSSQIQEEVSLAVTEVLNSDADEKEVLKEELSQPAAEPLKHNPEEKKSNLKVKFAQNRTKSTLDRVMETISNK